MKENTGNIDFKSINTEIKDLKTLFRKESTFEQGKQRFLLLQSSFYKSKMSERNVITIEDILYEQLTEDIMRRSVNEKGRTIIYGLWHASRIEDITMNMLVMQGEQIYNKKYRKEINSGIDHTGNSLSREEILEMSKRTNIKALEMYRIEVGKQTQKIISEIKFIDLKRKVLKKDIDRVRDEGAVDNVPAANWLLTFWGNKNVEGLLFMPACRHQLVHLRENFRAKKKGANKVQKFE